MATFTKIADSETPSIRVSPRDKVAKINDNIYGGFVE
jgi:alpha-L-arabinofuranosidase